MNDVLGPFFILIVTRAGSSQRQAVPKFRVPLALAFCVFVADHTQDEFTAT